jgi:hypothetical protein
MTVGTLESKDVVVDADGVSRVHAVFERFGDAWCVRDLGSRNGTFVNPSNGSAARRVADPSWVVPYSPALQTPAGGWGDVCVRQRLFLFQLLVPLSSE